MTFEEKLRNRIATSVFGSDEKNLLKVVLGELQRKSVGKPVSDETGYNVVKGMVKANEEVLRRLRRDDQTRRDKYEEENEILVELLPTYWSAEEIRESLGQLDFSAINTGQAMGLAMKHLKGLNAPVEGDTVKKVVEEMRA